MTMAEKLKKIAENEQKVYDAGYEKGKVDGYAEGYAEALKPASINLVRTITDVYIASGVTAGSTNLYTEAEGCGYSMHYYELSKTVKGGQIQIVGHLGNSFESATYSAILLMNNGVVAIDQSTLNVSPITLNEEDVYTITLPTDVTVNGIYLSSWGSYTPPVCTYIE